MAFVTVISFFFFLIILLCDFIYLVIIIVYMALNAVCIQVYLEMFERHVHMK